MKKTKQLFAGLMLLLSGLGTLQAEQCASNRMEGNVCLPQGFPEEAQPGSYLLNLTQGHTQISHDVYNLHMLVFWICVLVGVGVFGTMFYSIYHHRKSKGHAAAQFHESTLVEIIWTIIPAIILVAMAIPATKTMMEMDDVEKSDMTIKVTGIQWKWKYEYLNEGLDFISSLDKKSNDARQLNANINLNDIPHYLLSVDEPLVIPVKKKIRFVFTADDVIHSWWVPDLGWKKDAIPGFINEAWTSVNEPGIYRGQCTELCGKDHAFMPVVVIAMEQKDYDEWVQKKCTDMAKSKTIADMSPADLVKKGAEVYANNCAACHQADGSGGIGPKLSGSALVIGDINKQTDLVMNGKGAMPAFAKQLSATDLAAVITFTRNGLGNKVGDDIQPKAIKEKMPDTGDTDSGNASCGSPAQADAGAANVEKVLSKKEATPGQAIYEAKCSSCHQKDGSGMPPMFPKLTGSAVVNGDINAQASLVFNGKNAMPAFGSQLSVEELAQVITYTRNALGNTKGDSIDAAGIKALKSSAVNAAKTESIEQKPAEKASADVEKVKPTTKSDAQAKPVAHSVKADDQTKAVDEVDNVQFASDTFYPKVKISDKPAPAAVESSGSKQATSTGPANTSSTLKTLADRGASVYEKNCQSCHQKDGSGMPPMFPAIKNSPVVTGKIDGQIQLMLKGKGAMPAVGKMLSAEDFAAVVAFTRNRLGNSVGDFKEPAEIKALQSAQ